MRRASRRVFGASLSVPPIRSNLLTHGVVLALAAGLPAAAYVFTPVASAQEATDAARQRSSRTEPQRPQRGLQGLGRAERSRPGLTLTTPPDQTLPPDLAAPRSPQAARTPARRKTPRRSRPPTAAIVRAPVQAIVTPRAVDPDVVIPVSGLPDPFQVPLLSLRRRLLLEPDPYASLGMRSGGLTFFPALEQGFGYDSNPNRLAADPRGSPWLRTDGQLRVESNWGTHEFRADLRGGYSAYPDHPEADRPDGIGVARLRLDIARDARLDLEGRYVIQTQRPGSPEIGAPIAGRPLIVTVGESLEATKSFNRLSVALRGSVDRTVYEDAQLPNGTILPQGDRNQTTYGLRIRTAYELKPGFTPFVDALLDERVYDQAIDNAGFRRTSSGIGGRIGSTIEIARTLTGELSAGYLVRRYEDARLRDGRGPVAQASLIWAATPLTTFRLRAASDLYETTVPGASTILARSGTLEAQHDFRRNLSLTLSGTVYENVYDGAPIVEQGWSAAALLDYRMTRWLALRGAYRYEQLRSNVASSSFNAHTYLIGLRFQP